MSNLSASLNTLLVAEVASNGGMSNARLEKAVALLNKAYPGEKFSYKGSDRVYIGENKDRNLHALVGRKKLRTEYKGTHVILMPEIRNAEGKLVVAGSHKAIAAFLIEVYT